MVWAPVATVRPGTAAFDARATSGDSVILRGFDRVVGWDGMSDEIAWCLELPKDEPFKCKRLVTVGEVFAVVEDPGQGAAALIGFDAHGQVAWRTPLGMAVAPRGLAAAAGRFWALGAAPGKPTELVALDPGDGQVVERYGVRADQIAGCDRGVVLGWRDGLRWASDTAPIRIFDGLNVGEFHVRGLEVDFAFEDPENDNAPSIGRFDGATGTVIARVSSPEDVEEGPCAPVHRFGEVTVALLGEGAGVGGFDVGGGRLAWRAHQSPKLDVSRGAGLPTVWVANTTTLGRLVAVDARGREVPPPPTTAKDASFVFAHEGDLLVGGARVTERFRYTG